MGPGVDGWLHAYMACFDNACPDVHADSSVSPTMKRVIDQHSEVLDNYGAGTVSEGHGMTSLSTDSPIDDHRLGHGDDELPASGEVFVLLGHDLGGEVPRQ